MSENISVEPLARHIGALITGVDLRAPLSPAQVTAIREALVQWKVIFFRDQHLSHDQHIAFARQFGELTVGHPVFGSVQDYPHIYSVAKSRFGTRFEGARLFKPWTGWHTDVTAAINPPTASILRGVTIPPYGGDTQWTSLEAAYDALSPTLRGFLETLRGEHRFTPPEGQAGKREFHDQVKARELVSLHPLVRIHPESGRKSLFVSPGFLKRIDGLAPRESEQLLALLFEHVIRPEFTVRFKWTEGAIAFWDNRSTAHLAPKDLADLPYDRQLYRTTLVGDVPVGVNGLTSEALAGEPVLAYNVDGAVAPSAETA